MYWYYSTKSYLIYCSTGYHRFYSYDAFFKDYLHKNIVLSKDTLPGLDQMATKEGYDNDLELMQYLDIFIEVVPPMLVLLFGLKTPLILTVLHQIATPLTLYNPLREKGNSPFTEKMLMISILQLLGILFFMFAYNKKL